MWKRQWEAPWRHGSLRCFSASSRAADESVSKYLFKMWVSPRHEQNRPRPSKIHQLVKHWKAGITHSKYYYSFNYFLCDESWSPFFIIITTLWKSWIPLCYSVSLISKNNLCSLTSQITFLKLQWMNLQNGEIITLKGYCQHWHLLYYWEHKTAEKWKLWYI